MDDTAYRLRHVSFRLQTLCQNQTQTPPRVEMRTLTVKPTQINDTCTNPVSPYLATSLMLMPNIASENSTVSVPNIVLADNHGLRRGGGC